MIQIDLTPKMWVYHRKECPEGKIVTVPEAEEILAKGGWVKTPNEFPKVVKKTEAQKEEVKEDDLKKDVPHETIEEIKL